MTKEQLIIEYKKCLKSTPYALRTYLQTYDNTISRYVPLELFSDQFELVNDYENFMAGFYKFSISPMAKLFNFYIN